MWATVLVAVSLFVAHKLEVQNKNCGYSEVTSVDCYFHHIKLKAEHRKNRKKLEERNDSIYFIESSCRGALNLRQACSVESAALANPNRQVNVLFPGPVYNACVHTWPLQNILNVYPNIELSHIIIKDFLKNTPLENFLIEGKFNESLYPIVHMSDILRFVTLYKYGGIYLDLDMIVAKSFDELPESRNFAGKENHRDIGSAIYGFSNTGIGNLITDEVLRNLKDTFTGRSFTYNTVGIMRMILSRICKRVALSALDCQGFEIYEPKFFYPISFENHAIYFESSAYDQLPEEHFAFHVWNQMTKNLTVYSDSLYGNLMKYFCPTIYNSLYRVLVKVV